MSKGLVIKSKEGTTVIYLETGERWINRDMPLECIPCYENGLVYVNGPMTLTIDEWQSHEFHHITWSFEWPDGHDKKLMELASEADNAYYEKPGSPNCPACGAHDFGLHGEPCIHCKFTFPMKASIKEKK